METPKVIYISMNIGNMSGHCRNALKYIKLEHAPLPFKLLRKGLDHKGADNEISVDCHYLSEV